MSKNRVSIPANIRKQVEEEFRHRCAICGADKPHLHHIDENPANNNPQNLIPLCPNCHLNDQHSPTTALHPKLLQLFREYKDPTILKPQFYPLFIRQCFFEDISEDSDMEKIFSQVSELIDFVAVLEMGSFYSKNIKSLTEMPSYTLPALWDSEFSYQYQHKLAMIHQQYREQLKNVHSQVTDLLIELLRFQKW